MTRKHTYSFFLLFTILTVWNKETFAQNYTEYEVKAAYIFNFSKFVQWPVSAFESNDSPIILGIYGDDPFGTIIHNTFNRQVNGRSWVIKHLKNISDIGNCHILFVTGVNKYEMTKLLDYTSKRSILTIGDNINEFCLTGGIVNFMPQYSKNQFEINNDVAKSTGLSISSKLLILAKIVRTDEVKF